MSYSAFSSAITIPGVSVPTTADAQTYLASLSPRPKPHTKLVWGGTATDPAFVWSVDQNGSAILIDAPPLPVAQIRRTSKIGLTAAFSATGSQGEGVLTYAWTSSGGVAFATSGAVTTTATIATKGQYTITLTVGDAYGRTHSVSMLHKCDRVLEVAGVNSEISDLFSTLASAIAWVTANDAANSALYTILVAGVTSDTARVNLNNSKIRFVGSGALANGFGLYVPTGVGADVSSDNVGIDHITTTTIGIELQGGAGCSLTASNLRINAGTRAISCTSNVSSLFLSDLIIVTLPGVGAGSGIFASPCYEIQIYDSYVVSNGSCMTIDATLGAVVGGRYLSTTGVTVIDARGSLASHNIRLVGVLAEYSGSVGTANQFAAIAVNQSSANGVILVSSCIIKNEKPSTALLSAGISVISTAGNVVVSNCTAYHNSPSNTALAFVRYVGAGTVRVYNNTFVSAGTNGAGSYTNNTTTPVAWNPAQFNNNIIKGALVSITPSAGTALAGENLQVA